MNSEFEENHPDDRQTYAIIGAAIEVHKILGAGFLEGVYQEALALEFRLRGIEFQRERDVPIIYKGQPLSCSYRVDFLCHQEILVELKSLSALTSKEDAQVLNYLKATGLERALLINFGGSQLEYRRRSRSAPLNRNLP